MVTVFMDWRTPIALYIVLAYGLVRWMGKKYIVGDKRTRRLLLQFLVCFVAALVFAGVQGQVAPAFSAAVVVWLVGIINGVACFYSWKALDISMGKTSVFTIGDDIIAMSLSYVVLNEGRYINIWSGTGIVLSTLALFLFGIHAYRAQKRGANGVPIRCFTYIGIYSVLWGIVIFAERYFSAGAVPVAPFLLAWYGGSTVAALCLRLFMREEDSRQQGGLTFRDGTITVLYSLLIIACLGIAYWSYKTPQVIVQPLYLVAEAIVPTVIAFVFFKERSQFDAIEYAYLGMALCAVALIFKGYTG